MRPAMIVLGLILNFSQDISSEKWLRRLSENLNDLVKKK